MSTSKDNIDDWIKYVYQDWFVDWYAVRAKDWEVPNSAIIIIEDIGRLLSQGQTERVLYAIKRLEKMCGFNVNSISGEIYFECALAVYKLGDIAEAIQLLGRAIADFKGEAHPRAVAMWIKGCIMWSLPSQVDDAIMEWEESRNLFKTLERNNTDWYRPRIQRMRKDIDDATKANAPQRPPIPSIKPTSSTIRHSVRMLPILGEIRAGQMYNVMPHLGAMEFEEVCLLGEYHRIVNLRPGSLINLLPKSEHFILRVNGNSMNAATPEPIEDGDYVLMRHQPAPNHMDIVAAEIVGPDAGATLKRYRFENNSHYLYPESNDPAYQEAINPHPEWQMGRDFFIRGIALAVLKKIEQ